MHMNSNLQCMILNHLVLKDIITGLFPRDKFGQNQFEPIERIFEKYNTGKYLTTQNGMDCQSCGHFRIKQSNSDILLD